MFTMLIDGKGKHVNGGRIELGNRKLPPYMLER